MTKAEFGPALGASQRTAIRWEQGKATPSDAGFTELASRLVPVDLDLAAEAAAAAGESLESLGLVAPPPPPPPPQQQKQQQPPVTPDDLADAVVCAVADLSDLQPRALRPLLHAAFARARALGLTVDQVEQSLRARLETAGRIERAPARTRVRIAQDVEGEREPAESGERNARAR
jgi:hypothetical protein